jgi:hypothetical protein
MKKFALIFLLVASEAIGLGIAEIYNGLFLRAVPPTAMSGFNVGATHTMFLFYGLGVGLVLFAWAMLAVLLSRLIGGRPGAKS